MAAGACMPIGVPKRELSVWQRVSETAAEWPMTWLFRLEANLNHSDSAYPETAVNVNGHQSCSTSFGRCTPSSDRRCSVPGNRLSTGTLRRNGGLRCPCAVQLNSKLRISEVGVNTGCFPA